MTTDQPNEWALEKRARELEGRVLDKVWYQHRISDKLQPHQVGLAVYLGTPDALFKARWADELHLKMGFGIAIDRVRALNPDDGPILEATGWPVGETIRKAHVQWQDIQDALRSTFRTMLAIGGAHLGRSDYPAELQLTFANAEVSIGAYFVNQLNVTMRPLSKVST